MKKFLLSAMALLLGVSGMSAAKQVGLISSDVLAAIDAPVDRKAAAASTPRWDCYYFLGSSISAGYFNTPGTYKLSIVIPEDKAKQCIGSKLTSIVFYMGTSTDSAGSVFITKGLGGETIWEKEITLNLGTLSGNSFNAGENVVELDEPYVFTGEEIAIGYKFKAPRNTAIRSYYPFCYVNEDAINEYCDNVSLVTDGEEVWDNIGVPLTIMAGVEGENLPLWAIPVGYDMSSVVKTGEAIDIAMQFVNIGGRQITSFSGFTGVDGVNGEEQELPLKISSHRSGVVNLKTAPVDKDGLYLVNVAFDKVNGEPMETAEAESYVKAIDKGVKRRVVFEEWTGTWCGFCPRGIWGMEYMKENYPDDFIGIGVHYNDDMQETDYITSLVNTGYVAGFPGGLADRMLTANPSPNDFVALVKEVGGEKGFGDISIDARYIDEAEKTLEISGNAKIVYDRANVNDILAKSQYRVSFVITENGVAGTQANYFAGGGYGLCGGWESYPSSVNWKFDDVARLIDTFDGVDGLLPAVMEKDKEYAFTHQIKLPSNVKVGSNIDIIAMLVNTTTGFIENAVKIAGPQRVASIDAITAGGSASAVAVSAGAGEITVAGECAVAEVYGFNGVRVAEISGAGSISVAPGLYVVRTMDTDGNSSAVKVAVR